ncbi:SMI1/KNR4 family protein [Streptomyces sp. NPDC029674]|uniref:SMI1/KNR4 family protein n=1 Tax=Streptomyces sp. NPDC029674 TaxID=3365297 RepID=UPI0038517698
MGIREAQQFIRLVRDHPEESVFAGGCSEADVTEAEQRLGVAFPESYKLFLRELGDCDVAGDEFYGIVRRDGQLLGVVMETLALRESADLPSPLVAFRPDGMGGYFVLDTSRVNPDGEAPVYAWGSGTNSPTELDHIGTDFGTVALDLARRGLRDAELANALAEAGLLYLGLVDVSVPLMPPCLAFSADSVETGGQEWVVSVESDEPDLPERVNHGWYLLSADQGLFPRDAPEFLIAVGGREAVPAEPLRWARVALTGRSDIAGAGAEARVTGCGAGHVDFAMLSLDGTVVVRGVEGEEWTDCVLLKDPHRLPAMRELGTRMASSPETPQETREALKRWLKRQRNSESP